MLYIQRISETDPVTWGVSGRCHRTRGWRKCRPPALRCQKLVVPSVIPRLAIDTSLPSRMCARSVRPETFLCSQAKGWKATYGCRTYEENVSLTEGAGRDKLQAKSLQRGCGLFLGGMTDVGCGWSIALMGWRRRWGAEGEVVIEHSTDIMVCIGVGLETLCLDSWTGLSWMQSTPCQSYAVDIASFLPVCIFGLVLAQASHPSPPPCATPWAQRCARQKNQNDFQR